MDTEMKEVTELKTIESFGYFHSKVELITSTTNLQVVYFRTVERILEQIINYQQSGTEFQFDKIEYLHINIDPITSAV